ncbi:hypothetical protein SDC9_209020 [bioreactor metagenome]|uniref:Uncharacterized protein n=1 Tax=bioreactor metagenome TaxID=1076179 RepID=A0A645JC41_9ZZZZ
MIFLRSKELEIFFGRYFQVHTHAIGIQSRFVDQLPTGSGDTFHVYISIEPVRQSQFFDYPHHPFHGVIGTADNPRTQKQPFDIIASIKGNGQLHQLLNR